MISVAKRRFGSLLGDRINGLEAKCCAILGTQFGNEGKRKILNKLLPDYDICGKFNNGFHLNGRNKEDHFSFNLLPTGILNPQCTCLIGNNVLIHFPTLLEEMKKLQDLKMPIEGKFFISNGAFIKIHNNSTEEDSLLRAQLLKTLNRSFRIVDLVNWKKFEKRYVVLQKEMKTIFSLPEYDTEKELKELKEFREITKGMIIDGIKYINEALDNNKRVLLEDDGGDMLGINYGACSHTNGGLSGVASANIAFGIAPRKIDTRIGIIKAYCTRSDNGQFPTEVKGELCEHFIKKGREYSYDEKRRCGWLDLNMLRLANRLNKYTSLMITKLDVLDDLPEIKIADGYKIGENLFNDRIPAHYENAECIYRVLYGWMKDTSDIKSFKKLPKGAKNFVRTIEEALHVPVTWISVGKTSDQLIRL